MKHWKDILISAMALMLITGVVTAALAGTNALTADAIAKRVEETENAARLEVMDAERFEKATVQVDKVAQEYYVAYRADAVVGYVFTTVASGKSAGLTVLTGISVDGTITGVIVTEDNETAGYVDKVNKEGLLTELKGKPAVALQMGADVDAVSGATKTSKGVVTAVNQAIAAYQVIVKGGGC